jgi:potassium efflux system protein
MLFSIGHQGVVALLLSIELDPRGRKSARTIMCVSTALVLLVLTALNSAYSADSWVEIYDAPAPVSMTTLASKIKDAEANTDPDDADRARLLTLYRKTIRSLEEMRADKAATDAFIRSRKTDPEQSTRIREKLEKRKAKTSAVTADIITAQTPLTVAEQHLFTEKANLEAVKAKLSDLEQQLALAAARPKAIRQRLIEARRNQENITAQLLQPVSEDKQPLLVEATRWMLQTRQLALRTEFGMLDQELLSLPMHIDLLEAGQSRNAFAVEQLEKRVDSVQKIVNQQRQLEAEKAKEAAEKTQRELEEKHPLIQQLAASNAALTDALSQLTNEFERVTRESDAAKKVNERITDEFQNIRRKLEVGGFGLMLGQVLIEQQLRLPDLGLFRKKTAARADRIAEASLQQLQYSDEYKQLSSSLSDYVDQLAATEPEKEVVQIRGDLEKLAVSRQNLLKRLINLNRSYLRSLSDFEFSDQELLNTIQDYQSFFVRHFLLIRSGPLPSLATLREMPSQLAGLIAPARWREVATALGDQATSSPVLLLGLIVAAVLLWKTKSMRSALKETGAHVGKISQDRIAFTFHALGLTSLLAALWPLLLATVGWQLKISSQATNFTNVISLALLQLSVPYFGFRVFCLMCEPDGLASVHFHVSESSLQLLHRELGRLMLIFLPSVFIFVVLFHFDLALAAGEVGRFLVAAALIALAVFFYNITAPKQSVLLNIQTRYPDSWVARWHRVWRPLLVATPLILIGFDFLGYIYTTAVLTMKLIDTLGLIVVMIIVKQVAFRWLLLTQRRLALQAALERRAEAKAKKEAESSGQPEIESESYDVEEPEIDFAELSHESQQLLNMALTLFGFLGLLLIWADILSAFNLLNDITLWSHMATVSGEQQLVPVTLRDLGLAGLTVFVTVVAAKHLPSLLEIIMLQQTELTAGSRYTVTTMTNYIIVAVGMILFFNMIGVDWSKVQWLVAALGVGIGFGLQEIVANFISGIIILFERPIRVGDIVTIGNNEGAVVRIRIRATTIRNWDRKELLVPNKEFITGQLINWTLSDSTTRIVIPVGLAYGGDVERALEMLLEAAEEHPDVLSDPAYSVVFDAFGDNALSLKLRCFVAETAYRMPTITALHSAINRKFNDAGLVIAFPQRDVHLDTHAPLDIRIRDD